MATKKKLEPEVKLRPILRVAAMVSLVLGALGVAAFSFAVVLTQIPQPNEVAVIESTAVFYADGKTLVGNIGEIQRVDADLNEIPLHVQNAVLAIEDRDFYSHAGFSVVGIGRAFFRNLFSGTTQGGSTITQQYAKNAYLSQEQTIIRKLKELVLAVKLETVDSKDQILEDYLNTAYWGRSSYGIEAAAQAYFDKPATDLSLSEGAVLAALLRSPGGYAPETDKKRLKDRWSFTLGAMVEEGWATTYERDSAKFPKFKERQANRLGGPNGHLLAEVRSQLNKLGFTDQEIDLQGLTVISTFEKDAQIALNEAVVEQGPAEWPTGLRIGAASVRPGTGEILAIYGGQDYVEDQFNNATQARGQAGSTFKPFGIVAGFEQGIGYQTIWNGDSPALIEDYLVNNLGKESYGKVTLIKALEKSMNTPMVALGAIVGVENVLNAAVRSGVPANTPGLLPVLSTIIGTSSPTPLDMAAAYSTFASRGLAANTSAIKQVIGEDENVLWEFTPRPQQVFDAPIMDEINFGLARVVTRGTGFAATGVGRPVAGKTGTSDDNLSAWFVGYTPQIATSVMMVREDESGRAISLRGTGGLGSVTGGSFPARIFTQYMRNAHKELPVVNFAERIKIEGTADYSTYFTNPGEPLPTDETTLDPGPAPDEEAVPGPKG